jgi:hypothetical protein
MSCDVYTAWAWDSENDRWYEQCMGFCDTDDMPCLCSLNETKQEISRDQVKSMAYLGAAVALNHHGVEVQFIPQDLPDWLVEQIDYYTDWD